jgi:hypothetical protein
MSTDSSSADTTDRPETFDLPFRIMSATYKDYGDWDLLISVQLVGGGTRDFRVRQTPERLLCGDLSLAGRVLPEHELDIVNRQRVLDVMPKNWGFTWHMMIMITAVHAAAFRYATAAAALSFEEILDEIKTATPKPCGSGTAADPGAHSGPRTEDDDPYSEGDYTQDPPTDS